MRFNKAYFGKTIESKKDRDSIVNVENHRVRVKDKLDPLGIYKFLNTIPTHGTVKIKKN